MTTSSVRNTSTGRILAVGYGGLCYLVFLASFAYAIAFVMGLGVPRTVDRGIAAPPLEAFGVNVALLSAFAIQHSVMARPAFKRCWTRIIPASIERSTYVLAASLLLGLLCWQWRTIEGTVWHIGEPAIRLLVWALAVGGWVMVLATTFMINHFELFGLRQVLDAWRGTGNGRTGFKTTLLYRLVRHPLMLGFLIAFWAAPTMTAGHLLFAVATTGYILVALRLEERDLTASLGEQYCQYRRDVPMLIPHPVRHG
ncbi:methanethiol S-methyltransferase [Mycolicibacterium pyrenivorans]|uniref:methanethiol S-methyltransferase n=1 Tax=Mycolicibacterium pyrenivorans TaxID=187102 RepID=UPI0021F38D11|nr:methanethiol S-methyltransferase [Mycolicibacterium pyrenivorans]MCV7150383.1 isoprenylcysteine carboxylmethyltransferase family protein [Mycolicibacterium pyrenivorans]